MLRKAGYYTASTRVKWHLDHSFDARSPEKVFAAEMGCLRLFRFRLPVDGLARTLGSHRRDHEITGGAIAWMREKGSSSIPTASPGRSS